MLTDREAEELKSAIRSGGWPSLDIESVTRLQEYEKAQADRERRAMADIVRRMAATPEGGLFLDRFLRPRTIEMRETGGEAQATTAEALAIAAARRQGRNSIWWAIQDALADDTAAPQADVRDEA